MKIFKSWKSFVLIGIIISFFSFTHKFYVSVNQVEWNEKKSQMEITSRYFLDDMNRALEKKHQRVFYLGDKKESAEDVKLLIDYLLENNQIIVNQKKMPLQFHLKELEDDVLICYLLVKNVNKPKKITIKNATLMELEPDQQNILHVKFGNQKFTELLVNSKKEKEFVLKN
ncbi:MAG: DUF6702 family protein [Flavobacterium sp.]